MSMDTILASIPPNALTLQLLPPGHSRQIPDGQVNRKITPCNVIAQVLFGAYEITCEGRHEMIRPGEAFLTPGNRLMTLVHHGDARRGGLMGARWLYFYFTLFNTLSLTTLLDLPLRLEAGVAKRLGEVIQTLLELPDPDNQRALQWLARRQELAWTLLRLLCERGTLRPESQAILLQSQRLAAVFSHIHDHIGEPICVAHLARATHMSLSRFHCFFHEHMDCTPMEYVKRIRLNEACKGLMTSDASIAQIAEQVGFSNQFHFSREFKACFGMTPSRYRLSSNDWFSDAAPGGSTMA
jgi:AraC-like DNA-binding protein